MKTTEVMGEAKVIVDTATFAIYHLKRVSELTWFPVWNGWSRSTNVTVRLSSIANDDWFTALNGMMTMLPQNCSACERRQAWPRPVMEMIFWRVLATQPNSTAHIVYAGCTMELRISLRIFRECPSACPNQRAVSIVPRWSWWASQYHQSYVRGLQIIPKSLRLWSCNYQRRRGNLKC